MGAVSSSVVMALIFLIMLLSRLMLSQTLAPLRVDLTEWKILPTGEIVSCPEKRRGIQMEDWRTQRGFHALTQLYRREDLQRTIPYTTEYYRLQDVEFNENFKDIRSSGKLIDSNSSPWEKDVASLLAFKQSIQIDPLSVLANWTIGKNSDHCRTWTGVTCNKKHQVTKISLPGLQLNGTITPMIGDLAYLSYLNLSSNNFNGEIPLELMNCHSLSTLDLSVNLLGGQLPPQLGKLSQLNVLWLSHNSFSGFIPASLGKCHNLTSMDLSHNNLSGSIPAAFGELRQLQELWLENNHLAGSIPTQLGLLNQLQSLALMNNGLTGPIPSSLGNCTSLVHLLLGNNELTGAIPVEFGQLSLIQEMGLEYNGALGGPVPGFLSNCSQLQILFLGACNFTSIALEIWSMTSLRQLALFSNSLTGELPLEVGNCTGLRWLDLGWPQNNLTGSIPKTLGNLKDLITLNLIQNSFTGGIPSELGSLPQLTKLLLDRNSGLGGPIPQNLASYRNFSHLSWGHVT
ncbi:hypothetical protein O6H91_24G001400 [Diphasiastrum complanatum]|uniref:Uncharacterized protein n=1 Tax=Diphasiastrum complanatum TaxID=34168 RepID=A0ACC2A749_DIPCM|nr:hypothetical protein O6H91_24G001400 [Diphasiastrum complanatum]